jgi:hypothetical protein
LKNALRLLFVGRHANVASVVTKLDALFAKFGLTKDA